MTTVTVRDLNELGYCMKSVRPWFGQHNLDFMKFVREGISADVLLPLDDEFARQAIAHAQKRESAENG